MATPAPSASPTRARSLTRHALFLLTSAAVVLVDQATKSLVRARLGRGEEWPDGWPVNFTHVTNSGAAFGILQNETTFLVVMAIVGVVAIAVYYLAPPVQHPLLGPGLGLVLGGAIGNLIDRVRQGYVTDFIAFPNYPKFNVADSAITIGVVVLIALVLLIRPPEGKGT